MRNRLIFLTLGLGMLHNSYAEQNDRRTLLTAELGYAQRFEADHSGAVPTIQVALEVVETLTPEALIVATLIEDSDGRLGRVFAVANTRIPKDRTAQELTDLHFNDVDLQRGHAYWLMLESPLGSEVQWHAADRQTLTLQYRKNVVRGEELYSNAPLAKLHVVYRTKPMASRS